MRWKENLYMGSSSSSPCSSRWSPQGIFIFPNQSSLLGLAFIFSESAVLRQINRKGAVPYFYNNNLVLISLCILRDKKCWQHILQGAGGCLCVSYRANSKQMKKRRSSPLQSADAVCVQSCTRTPMCRWKGLPAWPWLCRELVMGMHMLSCCRVWESATEATCFFPFPLTPLP